MCRSKRVFINKLIVVGCLIIAISSFLSCSNNTSQTTKNQTPTFVDIAPIIFKNCTPCHRAGESGPFELQNYDDVKKNANKIKFVTQTGYMPPWPADPNYTHFIGERLLTAEEKELIKLWVEQGTPKGNEDEIPKAPVFYTGSYFGKPDTVIKFVEPVPIKGNGVDHFYSVKLPMNLLRDTFVQYFEFVPSQRKLAHHVNGHLINYESGRKANIYQGISYATDEFSKNYKETYAKMNILNDDQSFPVLTPNALYYLPGYAPPNYPQGIGGYKVNKTMAILLQNIHYGPSIKDVVDTSYVNVFYGSKPKRPIFESQLGTFGISKIEPELIIYPNKVQTFYTHATLNGDATVLSINPHMHLLGKSFWAFAIKPGGDTIPLIKIHKWDFKWQYYYTFEHPVIMPKGTTIHVYGTFDNTNKNPNNPNKPPKTVTQGDGIKSMQTTEEMFQFIFTYLPYQPGDEKMDLRQIK